MTAQVERDGIIHLMTLEEFRAWHASHGFTYDSGAAALGVGRRAYADMLKGVRRDSGKPVEISRTIALACAAITAGIAPLGEVPLEPATAKRKP